MSIMLNYVLVAVVAFIADGGVTAFALGMRRGLPAAITPAELPTPLQESITAFGEELSALTVTPAELEAIPRAMEDYRTALTAYDRAVAAQHQRVALAALREGRAALIRLAARRSGRPVPIDALPPLEADRGYSGLSEVPKNVTGERFLILGGDRYSVEELIDRPEPGRPAIVEVTSKTKGEGTLFVTPVVRTEDETDTWSILVNHFSGPYQGRFILSPKPTHLRIEGSARHWSVRMKPMSAAPLLGSEWRGVGGNEVLFYEGGPAILTVQARSHKLWQVQFKCGCLRGRDCRCRTPRWPADMPEGSDYAHGSHDGRRSLRLPRPGYLILDSYDEDHEWYLSVEPVSEAPEPKRKARWSRRRSSS